MMMMMMMVMLTIMISVDLICDSCDGNKQGRTCAGPAFPCPLCVHSPLFQDMQLCIMHYALCIMHYAYQGQFALCALWICIAICLCLFFMYSTAYWKFQVKMGIQCSDGRCRISLSFLCLIVSVSLVCRCWMQLCFEDCRIVVEAGCDFFVVKCYCC